MKNFILSIFIVFTFVMPQEMFAQTGCVTTPVSYRDGLGNYICPVGAYTLCCDGSFTVTGLQATTKIKVNWSEICDVYGNGAGDCNQTFSNFPAGTVTPGSNFFLEFQSGDFDPDGCGMDYGLVFNIGVQLGLMNCFDGGSGSSKTDDNSSAISTSEVILSPNPAKSFVNISNPDAKNLIIEIYNIRGQRLLSQTANQTSKEIDINGLTNGMYLVRVQDAVTQEYISSEKLIVAK